MSPENKNNEFLLDGAQLYHTLAELCVVRGVIIEPVGSGDGRGFKLAGIPPLTQEGISEIEYRPAFTDINGSVVSEALNVTYDDPDIDKSALEKLSLGDRTISPEDLLKIENVARRLQNWFSS